MLISKTVIMKFNTYMKKYYSEKGYNVGKRGDTFEISVFDLSPNSNAKVLVSCDFCGIEYEMMYCKYLLTKDSGNCCKKCKGKKAKKTSLDKYGVENISQLESTQEKRRKTCLKIFGFPSNSMSEESKKKLKETNMRKYGYEYGFQSPKIREKIEKTNLEKYGAKNVMKNNGIKSKVRKSLYENSSCPSSKGQKHICKLYGGELNYPFGWYSLDIYIETLGIYVEYQGSGHNLNVKSGKISEEEFLSRQIARYNYLKKFGLKMMEFINEKDKLPSDKILNEILSECIKYFNTSDRNYIKVNLDEIVRNKITSFSIAN